MKNSNIRILVVLGIISLVGIISTQVYWLNRAIDQQDQVFNYNVQVALRNVVESLCEASGKEFPGENPIERVSGNYFIVRANDRIDLQNLEYLISAEIRKRSITDDFEYGVYDCQNDKMVYADNINLVSVEHKDFFPELEEEQYYFGVYFPQKSREIAEGLDKWQFTTGLTILVVVLFGYSLFVILKQKRLSEIQKDFINNVTHELKTPLSTLSLAASTLGSRLTENNRYVEIINQETERLQHHVENILQGALVSGKPSLLIAPINLEEFLSKLLERFRQQYQRNMIDWELKADNISIETDTSLLDIVISNLVDNAVKYGSSKITIQVVKDKDLEIFIADNGIGIPKNQLKRIFKKFYRIPERYDQHNVKGFGLGLFIVKESVKRLGGKLSVESLEGNGSTFKISLPYG